MEPKVVHREIRDGDNIVSSFIPLFYKGAVKVVDTEGSAIAAFPDFDEGFGCAVYCTTPNSQIGSVEIHKCTREEVTNQDFESWFDDDFPVL